MESKSTNNSVTVSGMHKSILSVLEKDLIHVLHKKDHSDSYTEDYLLRKLFKNYRVNNQRISTGIRLSVLGNQLLRKYYKAYDFEADAKITHRALLTLDQNMRWPYYIGRKQFGKIKVTFYSEEDAAWFSLNGNDIENFVDYI